MAQAHAPGGRLSREHFEQRGRLAVAAKETPGGAVMSQEAQVMIYEYGCTPPLEGTPRVEQQMVAAHRYYNTLTERTFHAEISKKIRDLPLGSVAGRKKDRLQHLLPV